MVEQRPFPFQNLATKDARQAIGGDQIERAVELIKAKYGFVPTDLYVRDLIAFVTEVVTNEQRN